LIGCSETRTVGAQLVCALCMSSSGNVVLRYVFPVLYITSYLHGDHISRHVYTRSGHATMAANCAPGAKSVIFDCLVVVARAGQSSEERRRSVPLEVSPAISAK